MLDFSGNSSINFLKKYDINFVLPSPGPITQLLIRSNLGLKYSIHFSIIELIYLSDS